MTGTLAYCGLSCQTCPIYLATRQENPHEQARMRAEIARFCAEQYGMPYKLEDITDCDGCQANQRLFSACQSCSIRNCAREKRLENCAFCLEYACDRLETFFKSDPSTKTRLDAIRMGIR